MSSEDELAERAELKGRLKRAQADQRKADMLIVLLVLGFVACVFVFWWLERDPCWAILGFSICMFVFGWLERHQRLYGYDPRLDWARTEANLRRREVERLKSELRHKTSLLEELWPGGKG